MGITKLEALALIDSLRASGEDFCVVTVVRTADATSAKAGAKAVVTADGTLHGFVGGGCVQGAVRRVALQALAGDAPRLIRVRPREDVVTGVDVDGVELHKSSCPSGGTVDLFLEPMRQQMRLFVCGASPVAGALARLGHGMGHRVVLAARAEDHALVPGADAYVDGFDLAGLGVSPNDAIVVATQGKRDREALAGALVTSAAYVGMVGSRRKVGAMLERLADEFPPERLADVRGPAGLDIGAIEPEEIALSILGEVVEARRRGIRRSTPAGDASAQTRSEETPSWNSKISG
jgi:xanthine dehydrogenase accessory factor